MQGMQEERRLRQTANQLLDALEQRARRARVAAVTAAEAYAAACEAADRAERAAQACATARRAAETQLTDGRHVGVSEILAAEAQEIFGRREAEAAQAVANAAESERADRETQSRAASVAAQAAERRVEKVRAAIDRELGAAARLAAQRAEDGAADDA